MTADKLAREAREAAKWMEVTAHFLEVHGFPTVPKAKETFIAGIRDGAEKFTRCAAALDGAPAAPDTAGLVALREEARILESMLRRGGQAYRADIVDRLLAALPAPTPAPEPGLFIDGYFSQRVRNGETPPGLLAAPPEPAQAPSQDADVLALVKRARGVAEKCGEKQMSAKDINDVATFGMAADIIRDLLAALRTAAPSPTPPDVVGLVERVDETAKLWGQIAWDRCVNWNSEDIANAACFLRDIATALTGQAAPKGDGR